METVRLTDDWLQEWTVRLPHWEGIMKALLVTILLASCGAREAADAIREAQATPEPTPTPEAVTTEPEQPRIPRQMEEAPTPEPEATPTATPTPAPATVIIYAPATPVPMPTTEQFDAERKKRFELCRKDNLEPCRQRGVTGSAIYICAERECQDWKMANYAKLGPWKDWHTSRPPY
jgi:hypothetical protein